MAPPRKLFTREYIVEKDRRNRVALKHLVTAYTDLLSRCAETDMSLKLAQTLGHLHKALSVQDEIPMDVTLTDIK